MRSSMCTEAGDTCCTHSGLSTPTPHTKYMHAGNNPRVGKRQAQLTGKVAWAPSQRRMARKLCGCAGCLGCQLDLTSIDGLHGAVVVPGGQLDTAICSIRQQHSTAHSRATTHSSAWWSSWAGPAAAVSEPSLMIRGQSLVQCSMPCDWQHSVSAGCGLALAAQHVSHLVV